jgi:hypothetical protein
MHKGFRIIILLAILTGFYSCELKNTEKERTISVDVLPFPNKVLKRGGIITISNKNWVIANVSDSVSVELATYLVKSLEKITDEDALITDLYSTRKHDQSIKIEIDNNYKSNTGESYTLDITSSHTKIRAKSARGIYYGIQTLLQLLKAGESNKAYVLPKIVIKDEPRYSMRGITIKQSQINHLVAANLFCQLGAIKINSVFIIDDDEQEATLKNVASENYIKLYTGKEFPGNIRLISYGPSSNVLEEIYNTTVFDTESKGIVLDLTSTANDDLITKLYVLAELSWSGKDNHDYSRLVRLSQKVLADD